MLLQVLVFVGIVTSYAYGAGPPAGVFQAHGDVGAVLHAGSMNYDASQQSYRVTGSGQNIWATTDAFHFVWKKVSGDVTLSAAISFTSKGGEAHKKAVLMVRQSLDAGSAYADVALHADGLASLQWREEKGAATHEIQSYILAPQRLSIHKAGEYFYMSVAGEGQELHPAGGTTRLLLQDPFYVGIGVCAHNQDRLETAVFSNVELTDRPSFTDAVGHAAGTPPLLYSTLETIAIASTGRRAVYVAPERFEAPNWTRDGTLLFNSGGRIYRLPATGGQPEWIDTGFATRVNNDHGISPDDTLLAISDQSQENRRSIIYIVPIAGGTPRRVTQQAPSYWHGWSPDGKTLTFCGERNGNFDVYTIPAAGGQETRLTTAPGLDDGPDYSPDGQYIYFNSVRTGLMQIWRMKTDGREQEQVTFDEYNNWFPHISPDGKYMVFLSYEKEVVGHPENKDVTLRIMTLSDRRISVLAKLFGGQGTINVPSWSPDSRRLAFVSYQLVVR